MLYLCTHFKISA